MNGRLMRSRKRSREEMPSLTGAVFLVGQPLHVQVELPITVYDVEVAGPSRRRRHFPLQTAATLEQQVRNAGLGPVIEKALHGGLGGERVQQRAERRVCRPGSDTFAHHPGHLESEPAESGPPFIPSSISAVHQRPGA